MSKYFKMIKDNKIVDVSNNGFVRWAPKHQLLMYCTPEQAEYIQSSIDEDKFYHAPWLQTAKVSEEIVAYEELDVLGIQEIDEVEYTELYGLLVEGTEVKTPEPEDVEENPETDETIEEVIPEPVLPMSLAEMREMIEIQAKQIRELKESLEEIKGQK